MDWMVALTKKAAKRLKKLPQIVADVVALLVRDIALNGPVRGNWPNYSKLEGGKHHCHLKKGKPTYVAMWEQPDKTEKRVEVTYVGTHEKAPY